jgi:hypothetical protein
VWLWHQLSLVLGRTVNELSATMTRVEFLRWRAFFILFPFDDLHRIHRPAVLTAGAAGKRESIDAALKWLHPDPEQVLLDEQLVGRSDIDKSIIRSFRALGTKKRAPRK